MAFNDSRKGNTLCVVEVVRSERISPNFVRITLGGEQLAALPEHGYDHWFRLFLPKEDGVTSFDLPSRFDMLGYVKYLRMAGRRADRRCATTRRASSASTRSSSTSTSSCTATRDSPPAGLHAPGPATGSRSSIRAPASTTTPSATHVLLATDETGLPAVAGILRDLPGRQARHRDHRARPRRRRAGAGCPGRRRGALARARRSAHAPRRAALDAVRRWTRPDGTLQAYLVGEQALAAGATAAPRRTNSDVPKRQHPVRRVLASSGRAAV